MTMLLVLRKRLFVPRWLLASLLASSLSLLGAGCTGLPARHHNDRGNQLSGADKSLTDSGVVKTDFHREVGREQRVGTHLEFGRMFEGQGNLEAAIAEYQKAIDEADRHDHVASGKSPASQKALAHRHMAVTLDRMGQFARAEAHYREALRQAPNDANIWNDAGYSAYIQRTWDESERKLRTAARLAPNDLRVQTNLGLCLAAQGKTDVALVELSRAGGPAVGHANLAYVLAALGRTQDAQRHYEIALRLQPELKPARAALAQLEHKSNAAQLAASAGNEPKLAATAPTPSATAEPKLAGAAPSSVADPAVVRAAASSTH